MTLELANEFDSHRAGPVCDRFQSHTHMADGSIRVPATITLDPAEIREARMGLINRFHYLPDNSGNTTNPAAASAYQKLSGAAKG